MDSLISLNWIWKVWQDEDEENDERVVGTAMMSMIVSSTSPSTVLVGDEIECTFIHCCKSPTPSRSSSFFTCCASHDSDADADADDDDDDDDDDEVK